MSLNATDLKDLIIAKFDEMNSNNPDPNRDDYLKEMSKLINKYLEANAIATINWSATQTVPPVTTPPQEVLTIEAAFTSFNIEFSKTYVEAAATPSAAHLILSSKISIGVGLGNVVALPKFLGTWNEKLAYAKDMVIIYNESQYSSTSDRNKGNKPIKDDGTLDSHWSKFIPSVETWQLSSNPISTDATYIAKLSLNSFNPGSGIKIVDGKQVPKDYKENMQTLCENLIDKIKSSLTGVMLTSGVHSIAGGATVFTMNPGCLVTKIE